MNTEQQQVTEQPEQQQSSSTRQLSQSYQSKPIINWTVDDVQQWAMDEFEFEEIGKWAKQSFSMGKALLQLTTTEKAMKAGLPFGLASIVADAVVSIGKLSTVDIDKLKYSKSMNFDKNEVILTLYQFEQYLSVTNVSLHSKDWRIILIKNQSNEDFCDTKNQSILNSVLEKLSVDANWMTAKAAILEEIFPCATNKTWLGFLEETKPSSADTMKSFTDRWIRIYQAVSPLCEILTNRPDVGIEILHENMPRQFRDRILAVKPKLDYEKPEEYVETLRGLFPESFNQNHWWSNDWKQKKNIHSNDSNQFKRKFQNERKRKLNDDDGKSFNAVFNAKHSRFQGKSGDVTEKRKYEEKKNQNEQTRWCKHCHKDVFHTEDRCWTLHPDLAPKKTFGGSGDEKKSGGTYGKMMTTKAGNPKKGNEEKSSSSQYSCLVFLVCNTQPSKNEIQILKRLGIIDSGASDIFISKKLAQECGYQPDSDKTTEIDIPGGRIFGRGTTVKMRVNGEDISMGAYIIDEMDQSTDIILGCSCYEMLKIRIVIPMTQESPISRFLREHELHVTPSNSKTTFISDLELKILTQAVSANMSKNFRTKGLFSSHPKAVNVKFGVPKEAEKWLRQYKIPDTIQHVVKEQIQDMKERGVIEQYLGERSHNNPISLVRQKEKFRMVIDFRHLNQWIPKGNAASIPNIDEIFDRIRASGACYYTIIDLSKAYNKMTVHPDDRWALTFSWSGQRWEHVGCPFGISSLPAIFSELMTDMLGGLSNCANFFDDIIIFSRTLDEHITHVKDVLDRLTSYNMTINEKSKLGCKSVVLLGHIITSNGTIELDRSKLADIDSWQRPKSGKEVQQLLGFGNYFRRYFMMEKIVGPLQEVRSHHHIQWTDILEKSWNDLKDSLKKAVPLHLPDYRFPINIGVDASRSGLGMVAWQDIPLSKNKTMELKDDKTVKDKQYFEETLTATGNNDTMAIVVEQNVQNSQKQLDVNERMVISFEDSKMLDVDEKLVIFGGKSVQASRPSDIDSLGSHRETVDQQLKTDVVNTEATSMLEWNEDLVVSKGETQDVDIDNRYSIDNPTDNDVSNPFQIQRSIHHNGDGNNSSPVLDTNIFNNSQIEMTKREKEKSNSERGVNVNSDINNQKDEREIYDEKDIFEKEGQLFKRRFIRFQSRSLKTHERNYGATKLEGLGLAWSLKSMHDYIFNCPTEVNIYTDHRALVTIFNSGNELLNQTLTSWADTILSYTFNIIYIKGIHNVIPDILSRMYYKNNSEIEIVEATPKLRKMAIILDDDNYENLDDENLRIQYIHEAHHRGHFGIRHVIKLIHEEHKVHWKSIYADVEKIVRGCKECAMVQIKTRGYHPLNPVTASLPGDLVAVDAAYMKKGMSDEGYNYTLVLVDVATRYICLRPLRTLEGKEVGTSLIEIYNTMIGWPKAMLEDQGSEFVNTDWKSILDKASVQQKTTAPYHHRANGLVERNIQTFKNILKKLLEETNMNNWEIFLPWIQIYLNTRLSDHTGSTPFSLMYGRKPNSWKDYRNVSIDSSISDYPEMTKELNRRWKDMFDVIYPSIAEKVEKHNQEEKRRFAKSHTITEFHIGQRCMYLSPDHTEQKIVDKWGRIYQGPITIIRISPDGQRYVGQEDSVEDVEGNFTRDLPPSHLKLVADPERIIMEKEVKKNEWIYLVQYSDGNRLWIHEDSIQHEMLIEWKENQLLQKTWDQVKEKEYVKLSKQIQQQEVMLQQQQQQLQRRKSTLENWKSNRENSENIEIELEE